MKQFTLLFFGFLLIGMTLSCKKEGCTDEKANNFSEEATEDNGTCTYDPVLATVVTGIPSNVTINSASCGGTIPSIGTHEVTVIGVCWSTSPNPTTNDAKTAVFYKVNFSSDLEDLLENTTYYVRAYATSEVGTAYGEEVSFSTAEIVLPTVVTKPVTSWNYKGFQSGGEITNYGNGAIIERGLCWGTSPNPTVSDIHQASIESIDDYTIGTLDLTSEETYYIRAYATNEVGIAYGQEITYTAPHISFIGEFYQGGVVFKYNSSSGEGLICSLSDQSYGAEWGCETVQMLSSSDYWDGDINTENIVSTCLSVGIAAELCSNMSINGYNNWYLPACNEMKDYLAPVLSTINPILIQNGGDALSSDTYWSSTQGAIYTKAFSFNFSTNVRITLNKSDMHSVRAIRRISL